MNCDGVANLLSAYLDGELSPGELLRVEEHLRRCHACADEVDSLRQTVALVASLEEVEVPASFQASLHERLVALGPPMAAVRPVPAAATRQRNVRRWTMPAAAAAAVAALAIGVTQLQTGGWQMADGLRPQTGVFNVADQSTTGTTNPTPPVNVTIPPTPPKDTAVAKNDNPPSTGKDAGQPAAPPVGAGPGKLDGNGGASTAGTSTQDVPQKGNLTPQMAYSFTYTVAGPLDPKVLETLWYEYANHELVNNDAVIKVPATQEQIDKTQKRFTELFPGVAVKPTSLDKAADLQGAKLAADQAEKVYQDDLMLKASESQLAADISARDKALEYYKLLQSQISTAVFTIQFQPAQ